ncbi:MAG: kinase [Rhodobacteraceae bacterium]|nr:kinase [Paracoccaceae bacterium]
MTGAQAREQVLCIGAAHWDVIGQAAGPVRRGADLPGRVRRVPGGVALNVARWLAVEGLAPALLAAVGDDAAGAELLAAAEGAGIGCAGVLRTPGQATGSYVAIEGATGLVAAVADTGAMAAAGSAILAPLRRGAPAPRCAVIDGNLAAEVLAAAVAALAQAAVCVAGASPAKAARLGAVLRHPRVTLYLNRAEAAALCGVRFRSAGAAARALCRRGAAGALVTDGARAAAWADAAGCVSAQPPPVRVRRVTGAGDRLLAAHLAARRRGLDPAAALHHALDLTAAHISEETAPCLS